MTTDSVHRFLVAYDVGDDTRRTRTAKALQTYGDRIQYSVFLIDAKPAKLVRLRATLHRILDLTADSVLICNLGPLAHGGTRRIEFLGLERAFTDQGPLIL